MSEAYLTNWLSSQASDDRNHFHAIALHEARVASEANHHRLAPVRTSRLLDRVRAVLARTGPVERCDCPAAA